MKATGIIRRLDDLGRVVIPKEIRRTQNLREGDPLEIYVSDDGLVLRKYAPCSTSDIDQLIEKTSLLVEQMQDGTDAQRRLQFCVKVLHEVKTTLGGSYEKR